MKISLWTRALPALVVVLCLAACGTSSSNDGDNGGDQPGDPGPQPTANIVETFDDTFNLDEGASDADWGATEASILQSLPTTSRKVYCFGYPETWNGVNNGRGQYVPSPAPLIGEDYKTFVNAVVNPDTIFGRRVQIAIPDTKIGAAGTITGVAWGPHQNATFAGTYDNVKLRMGYLDPSFGTSLGSSFSGNYESAPTLLYDGSYTVPQLASVGNTPNEPNEFHVGGYPQNNGCTTTGGGHNKSLFDFTGFFDWPALTAVFNWTPGDFAVANDRILLLDMSAVQGSTFQMMRMWFAVTFPCSGILIGGYPERVLFSTYEGDGANPADNFQAGILNPSPAVMDTCFTMTRQVSLAQSKWLTGAYGNDTDYLPAVITPAVQQGNARIIVEFQGADLVSTQGNIVMSEPFTDWVTDINECDGMKKIRWRIQLIPDPATGDPARVDSIRIPMRDSDPNN